MSPVIRKTIKEQPKHWSEQLDSPVKDTKLDFCGEKMSVKLPNKFYSAIVQLNSLELRLQKDDQLQKHYQKHIDTDVNTGYVWNAEQVELNETRNNSQGYLPHHPVINPQKTNKFRRVCSAAEKYEGVVLNDKLLIGPNMLQSLIRFVFRFREHQIAPSVDLEVSSSCCPNQWQPMPALSMATKSRAENRSLRVYTTDLWSKEIATLCKLRFASSYKK